MAGTGKSGMSPFRLMMCIVLGCILVSCMTGVAGADGVSYGACQQGCRCLMESEAKTQFGNNYVRCSDTKCGEKTAGTGDVAISIPLYCYKAKEPVYVPLPVKPVAPQPQAPQGATTGGLNLNTVPSGANVVFDGVNRGTTPVTLTALTPGSHIARFSLAGYQEQSEPVTVTAGQTVGYAYTLTLLAQAPQGATTGGLNLNTIPSGANVVFDGANRGTTPATLTALTPGSHTARFSLAGYQEQSEPVTVTAGQTVGYAFTLSPVLGKRVSQGVTGDQVGVVSLQDDQVSVISLADDRDKLNPQPEPPKPADYTKLNPQPEPPKPADYTKLNPQPEPPRPDDYTKLNPQPEPPKPSSGGFVDSVFSFFTGLFAGNIQNKLQTSSQTGMGAPSSQQVKDAPSCFGLGLKMCNGQCVVTQSDPDNCGSCGKVCTPPLVCSKSECKSDCDGGLTFCSRYCVNLNTDQENCGACGKECAADQICDGGGCKCFESLPTCNGACTDIYTDIDNCGACGKKCGAGLTCAGGKCFSLANVEQVKGKTMSAAIAAANNAYKKIPIISPKDGDTYFWGDPLEITWDPTPPANCWIVVEIKPASGGHGCPDLGDFPNNGYYQLGFDSISCLNRIDFDSYKDGMIIHMFATSHDYWLHGDTSGDFTTCVNTFDGQTGIIKVQRRSQEIVNVKPADGGEFGRIWAKWYAENRNIPISSPKEGDEFYWGNPVQLSWDPGVLATSGAYKVVHVEIFEDVGGLPVSLLTVNVDIWGYAWNPADWETVPHSGNHRFKIQVSTPDQAYSSTSGWFTIKDNPFPHVQDIEQKHAGVAAKDLGAAMFHIIVRYPEQGREITQGDNVMIIWDKTNIKNYNDVKIELFRQDGTRVTAIGTGTGIVPNKGDYEWQTRPYQVAVAGSLPPWPDPEATAIRNNPGSSYVKISTPDGKYTGNSPVFMIKAKEVPYEYKAP